jgi:excisionase family DNA binding protein
MAKENFLDPKGLRLCGSSGPRGSVQNSSVLFLENFIWLKTNEAAEYLRIQPKQLRKWVYQGRVKAYKLLGKSLRFKKSELDLLFKGGRKWE